MNISWTIDLGSILTIAGWVIGVFVILVRRSTDVGELKVKTDKLMTKVSNLELAMARLEERTISRGNRHS